MGLPGWHSGEKSGDVGSIPASGRSPGVGKQQLAPVFLPWKAHGQRSLVGNSSWGHRESDMTEREHTHTYEIDD